MASLSVSDASSMAGVSIESMVNKINRGELAQTEQGIEVSELIRAYPNLKPLASLKLRKVKKKPAIVGAHIPKPSSLSSDKVQEADSPKFSSMDSNSADNSSAATNAAPKVAPEQSLSQDGTVELLVRELEWNKELLEQTNERMARQLAEQRALIADQARRLDEKDRFWARQIEIAQSLLPAPQAVPEPRKKIFGIF